MTMTMVAGAVLLLASAGAQAAAPARLTDAETKALIERIDHERDRFEDQLDGTLKRSILRSPNGEVNVERFLDDLQENVDDLKDRFTDSYAAGNEAAVVLRQGSSIQRYMETQPPNYKGASEWNQLASSLGQLAAAYGTTFPLPEGAPVRRIGDREVAQAAAQAAQAADRFRKLLDASLKKDKAFAAADRQAAVREADGLKRDANALASRVRDRKPASGEATQLLERAQRIHASSAALPLIAGAKTAWSGVLAPLTTIAQGFNLPALP